MDERNGVSGEYNSAKRLNQTILLLQLIPLTSSANSGLLSYLGMFLNNRRLPSPYALCCN